MREEKEKKKIWTKEEPRKKLYKNIRLQIKICLSSKNDKG